LAGKEQWGFKPLMLDTQYRMHPYIMKIPNLMFYNKAIKNDPKQNFKFCMHQNKPLLFVNISYG
jgi:superfamily I DNA and/or RNA helicase